MRKITLLLCAVAALGAPKALAQTADQEAQMKAWQAYMTPGDVHKMLAEADGDWKGDITMWMDPSAPPTKSEGTAHNKMIMGGRYQESDYTGSVMGMPFEGKNILAYDNMMKQFISTWIDNMGTGVMTLKGKWDEGTKTINFSGSMMDPMSGRETAVRETYTLNSKDKQTMVMYATMNGKEVKTMEIVYTRK